MRDVIIIGGGIMGLLTARELRKTGRSVAIIEKGRPGAGTTWASAGIISAHGTSGSADIAGLPGLMLRAASDEDWAHLAEAIAEESGTDIEYRLTGVLLIALDEEEAESIQEKARAREWGEAEWMPPDVLATEEPCLSNELAGALLVTGGNLEVRKLGPALALRCGDHHRLRSGGNPERWRESHRGPYRRRSP
ncbi:MAG: FAD-binding oxidoreductase [Nitrospinae bacterium]|nr:FAD-binding oxidoreductase [Nitrospinota bacterium]